MKNSSDSDMGHRPELKSDEFSIGPSIVTEILSCEDSFTEKKVLHLFGASVRGGAAGAPRPRGRAAWRDWRVPPGQSGSGLGFLDTTGWTWTCIWPGGEDEEGSDEGRAWTDLGRWSRRTAVPSAAVPAYAV